MYKIIINELKDKIEGGEYKPGDKIPTELELTKEYGVSRVTVVSALNELVKQKLITRYPKKGSFVSGSAPSETSGKKPFTLGIKHVFGFILPSIEDIFALNLIKGITKRIHDEPNISVMIASSRNQEHEEQIITDMLKRNLDGIILFPVDQEIYNERILEMKLQMYPLVLIDRYLPGINTHYVISDNVLSGRLAAEHLYGLGHENICVCSSASAVLRPT